MFLRLLYLVASLAVALTTFSLRAAPAKKPAQPSKKASSSAKPSSSASKKRPPAKKSTAQSASKQKSSSRRTSSARSRRSSRSWKYSQRAPSTERYQEIERALLERGYLQKTPDGKWGPESVAALRRFQADNQLSGEGKLTSLSLIALGLGPRRPAPNAALLAEPQSKPGDSRP